MAFDSQENGNPSTLTRKTKVSIFQRILWIFSIFYYQVLAVFTVLIIWILLKNYEKDSGFFWRMFLSTVAFVPLMSVAIVFYSENNVASLFIQRNNRHWTHGTILGISCIFLTVGIFLKINYHNVNNLQHFITIHGILGLTAWILMLVSVVMGLLTAHHKRLGITIRPVFSKLLHNFLGIATFTIGMASLLLKLDIIEEVCSKSVYVASLCAFGFIIVWSVLDGMKSFWRHLQMVFQ